MDSWSGKAEHTFGVNNYEQEIFNRKVRGAANNALELTGLSHAEFEAGFPIAVVFWWR